MCCSLSLFYILKLYLWNRVIWYANDELFKYTKLESFEKFLDPGFCNKIPSNLVNYDKWDLSPR